MAWMEISTINSVIGKLMALCLDLVATVTPPSGPAITPDIKDNGDGTYAVEYVPEKPGRYSVDVRYGDRRVPRSPFRVQVKPCGDASKVVVDGLSPDEEVVAGEEHDFDIDASKAGKGLYLMCDWRQQYSSGRPTRLNV